METFAGILVFFGVIFIAWVVIAIFIAFWKMLFSSGTPTSGNAPVDQQADQIDGMNNGDYYNGPHGYSPMTGYPETQYGSGFDPEAEWNHEEQ